MRKRLITISLILIIGLVILTKNNTYAFNEKQTFSRNELQKLVTSTALSYFYNKESSDYDQYSVDAGRSSFNWRNVANTPEMVHRANKYNIDCSSFALMTYLYSIGYDMSEHYEEQAERHYFKDSKWVSTYDSVESYKEGYLLHGKGWYGLHDLAQKVAEEASGTTTIGNQYVNNSVENKTIVVYHYRVKKYNEIKNENGKIIDHNYAETNDEITKIRNTIINTLQPGDILLYQSKKPTNESDKAGHVSIYVGGEINKNEKGFIHSTGNDFEANSNPIVINEDEYSVKYDIWEERFLNYIFKSGANGYLSNSFTILRPINSYCSNDTCEAEITSNSMVRNKLSRLKIEQYQTTEKQDTELSVSKYNSININDNITYNLDLKNMSKFEYCQKGNPQYDSKKECTDARLEWKSTIQSEISYKNLTIIGKIPEGTTYVSCTQGCNYNDNTKTVTWFISSIVPGSALQTYSYTVKNTSNNKVINPGMEINYDNSKLTLGKLETKVNPTINNEVNIDNINNNIETLATKGNMTSLEFINNIYYNSFGIDLTDLTEDNIKNAVFKTEQIETEENGTVTAYSKLKTAPTDEKLNNIYQMLVEGMYGGRLLKGNNGDRARFLATTYMEYGDIIITFKNDNTRNIENVYFYKGFDQNKNAILIEYNNGKLITYDDKQTNGKSGYNAFKEIFAKGLFVVLRPTQKYGNTISYNYNGGIGTSTSYVAYNTYKNLASPYKENYIVTLDYDDRTLNTNQITNIEAKNEFVAWHTNSNLSNKVTSESNLNSDNSHTLYAEWNTEKINLPTPTKKGYKFSGWYTNDGVKVSNSYTPTSNINLTAKWVDYIDKNPKTGSKQYYIIISIVLCSLIYIIAYMNYLNKNYE